MIEKKRKQLKVLHCLDLIKPNAIPWFYNIVQNTPGSIPLLSAWNNGYKNTADIGFDTVHYPFQERLQGAGTFTRLYNKAVRSLRRKHYPRYVGKRADSVDIVHAHFAHVGWADLPLKQRLNLPYVVSFYGYDYESIPFKYPIWEKRYQDLFSIADLILAEGFFGAKKLVSMGCPSEKVTVSRLGVDTANIPFLHRAKKEDELNLVQIAAFREKKGQVYTLEAFIKAQKDCPNMTLTLVGEDDFGYKDKCLGLLRTSDCEDKVTFVDRIDFSKLYDYLSGFHVFIHPSCYSSDRDCEGGAPIVLLDAQATGMPVISTFHCDIPDEVADGRTGLLAEEKDVEKIARHITAFYKMGQKDYDDFSSSARAHVKKEYDVKVCGERMYSNYESLLLHQGEK